MRIEGTPTNVDFATLELLPLGVIVVNDEGTILFYNNREEEISGRSRDDVVGTNFFRDVAPCTAVKEFYGRFRDLMAQGGGTVSFDFTFPFALKPRRVRINLHPFQKDQSHLCIIFVADLTEREMVRERILQSQRFSDLGEVAARVAHNFNNLLQVVRVSSELALEDELPGTRKHLHRVLAAVEDGSALVRRYQEIARNGRATGGDRVDLNASVAAAVDFARELAEAAAREDGRKVAFRMNLAEGGLWLQGDGGELREALLNLLKNAVEATPGEGTVRVLTSRVNGALVVDILDDGQGMDPEVQRNVFTPLFTTKGEKGTGLGLATVHSTIQRHGGAIELNSIPGKGTHFRITLPQEPG
jgi:photoactive yellow protein